MTAADEKMYLISESQLQIVEDIDKYTTKHIGDLSSLVNYIRTLGPDPVCDDTCVYKRFGANMENAAAHDAEIRKESALQGFIAGYSRGHNDTVEGTVVDETVAGEEYVESLRSEVKK